MGDTTTKVLLTGGAGFIGHHLAEHILKNTDWHIVVLDRLDTSGNLNRLTDIEVWSAEKHRVRFVFHDLKAQINGQIAAMLGGPFDAILHLAAGSHVDRSIEEPVLFFEDNAIGTVNLLEYARTGGLRAGSGKFLYFSTDEVYGPAPKGVAYREWDRHNPNNPYAASKSAAEMACIAAANTYRIPIVITNTMNVFGERQHPEKFIPLVIRKSVLGEPVTIHANKEKTEAGLRHYIHARNASAATLWILQNGEMLDGSSTKGRYNIVGEKEVDNLTLAKMIYEYTAEWMREHGSSLPDFAYEMVDFHSSRPGHDLRYALDGSHLRDAGFSIPIAFEDSLRKTVRWMLDHPHWLEWGEQPLSLPRH